MICIVLIVPVFQNCGNPTLDEEASLEVGTTSDPKILSTEAKHFPYELSINQVAYMSCPNTAGSSGVHSSTFTFKIGGYDVTGTPTTALGMKEGGLRINPSYFSELNAQFANLPQSSKDGKFLEALSSGVYTKTTGLEVALRSTQLGLRTMVYARGSSPEDQIGKFLPILSDSGVASALIEKAKTNSTGYTNYFPNVSEQILKHFESGISIPVGEGSDESVFRSELSNTMLVTGFADTAVASATSYGNEPFTKDKTSKDSMLGTGFGFTFSRPGGVNFSNYPARTISNIQEFDLSPARPQAVAANWNCSLKLKIVRETDRLMPVYVTSSTKKEACPFEPVAAQASSTAKAQMQVLRRFLPAEYWDINLTDKCVVPRNGTNLCYAGNVDPIVYDSYFFPTAVQAGQYTGCSVSGQYECAHYVTVCYKN